MHTNCGNVAVVQIQDVTLRHFSESFLSGQVSGLVAVLKAVGIVEFP